MSWIDSFVRLWTFKLIARPLYLRSRELIEPTSDVASAEDSNVQTRSLKRMGTA